VFAARLAEAANAVYCHFDTVYASFVDLPVTQGVAYATKGGKRLRAFLVLESARLHGITSDTAIWAATAIEAVHAYSLVHDDLPCMDNDDLRRGQPTVHIKWDDGTAVLVGDALHTLAFELVTGPENGPADVRAELALTLARAAGAHGMVLGQAMDIAAETANTPLSLSEITALQAGKTGALMIWAATAGAVLAQADTTALRQYAQSLGLAFQIADDILDVEGDAAKAGKRLQKDVEAGKATFVSHLGLAGAKVRASELVTDACDAISLYGAEAQTLQDAARFAVSRES
jgi:farnesyl diphosphate synthase